MTRIRKQKVDMAEREKNVLVGYLNGKMTAEQAGDEIGISKQQVINRVASILRYLSLTGKVNARKLIGKY